jgi:hypothetical protein
VVLSERLDNTIAFMAVAGIVDDGKQIVST